MEDKNKNEVTVSSMEELKEMIRALPEGMVLSVSFGEGGEDGEKERI